VTAAASAAPPAPATSAVPELSSELQPVAQHRTAAERKTAFFMRTRAVRNLRAAHALRDLARAAAMLALPAVQRALAAAFWTDVFAGPGGTGRCLIARVHLCCAGFVVANQWKLLAAVGALVLQLACPASTFDGRVQFQAPIILRKFIMTEERSGGGRASPVDRSVLADLCGGDAAFERRILGNFRRVTETDAPRLREAVSSSDAVAVTRVSHSIKGASRTIGAHELGDVCERIEQASRNAEWQTISDNMSGFDREIGRVQDYLKSVFDDHAP
jgi:HPt (histidine-containing phosphotransfer) domain-containing protein